MRHNRHVLLTFVLVLALGGGLALTPALDAKVVKYASRSGNFIFTTSPVLLPLNDSGATQISFNGGGGQKLIAITFSAVCDVKGVFSGWLGIEILVGGEVIAPTGIGAAFCNPYSGPATVSRTVVRTVGPGQHIVKVRAHLVEDTTEGRIGDSSLTIIN